MDILATQICEDYDSTPTQKISYSAQQSEIVVKINQILTIPILIF